MITVLKSKLHRVRVTASELDYEGSCAIDENWLDHVGIREFEQIQIYNVTNGERFVTYAIKAPRGSKVISVNGAAAWKAAVGDIIIIACYRIIEEYMQVTPKVIHFDVGNRIKCNLEEAKIIHKSEYCPNCWQKECVCS